MGAVFKKGGTLSLISIVSNPFQSEREWWFVLCLYTISISILYVSWGEGGGCGRGGGSLCLRSG